jgi:hypothetical protein
MMTENTTEPRRRRAAVLWAIDSLMFLVGCVWGGFAVMSKIRSGTAPNTALLRLWWLDAGAVFVTAIVGTLVLACILRRRRVAERRR